MRSPGIRRSLSLVLAGQAVVALLVLLSDLGSRWPAGSAPDRPPLADPVAPGDQRRLYAPTLAPPRTPGPAADPGAAPPDMPDRLDFRMIAGPDQTAILLVTGQIEEGDARRLDAFLQGLPDLPDRVALHSPGGSVAEALLIGRMLRDRGAATAVLPGMACLSACPYVLAGGTDRRVARSAAVGLHQHYYDASAFAPLFFAVEDIQHSQGATMQHLIDMGVDPGIMLHSLRTPPDEIYILLDTELRDSRLATDITDD